MTTVHSHPEHPEHDAAHGHAHKPYVAHHFESSQQQFDSGKLGIWLFLVTEVLFFAGLFCAYAVYRSHHPEIFAFAHRYLDTTLGAINTGVLLFSSLTMALGVRAAQLGNKNQLVAYLAITILCAFGFLGIKYVEYSHKIHDGILFGRLYDPKVPPPPAHGTSAVNVREADSPTGTAVIGADDASRAEDSANPHAAPRADVDKNGKVQSPRNTHIFFSIYFFMTGLHGVHVIIGIGVLGWILLRAMRGEFHGDYYGPVDFAGLYWHLVDLIWIYLFPLLYLIH